MDTPAPIKPKSNKKLFIIIGVVVVSLLAVGVLAMLLTRDDGKEAVPITPEAQTPQLPPVTHEDPRNPENQVDTSSFKFERFPFDIENIGSIAPIGEFAGINRQNVMNSHFYGNMRHYVFSKNPGKLAYNIYVPADGYIIGFRNNETTGEFRFNFEINSRAFYYLDHVQSISEEMKKKLEVEFGNPIRFTQAVEQVKKKIAVKAGDIIGQTGLKGIAWDWGFIDEAACDEILFPDHYMQDRCPKSVFDHLSADLQQQITPLAGYWSGNTLSKVNTTPPLGHYGHDVKGTLSGGWFLNYEQYYANAFFNPDSYEPNQLQIRLGIPELDLLGVWQKLPVGTNVNPDPKEVTAEDGIVIYNLAKTNGRDTMEFGMLLVRVNADDTITIEARANLTTPPANPSFTAKALTLKR